MYMKIKLSALLIASSLVIVSCGSSAKSECTKIMDLTVAKAKKSAANMPEAQRKQTIESIEKSREMRMKACMATTSEARAQMLKAAKM